MILLEARQVGKFYLSAKIKLEVLRDINLRIADKTITAIVGPSGAGKSTLLHILGGLDEPTSGQVLFEGRNLGALPEGELCDIRNSRIGFVFQFYHLLPEFNVLENVMMPALINPESSHRQGGVPPRRQNQKPETRTVELLKQVGLFERRHHFPGQLSGGERQRAAIARALINCPKLLLCDEPTGNLDSENGRQICQLLKTLNQEKGMTIVIVTHNLEVANLAFKVYNIKDGYLSVER